MKEKLINIATDTVQRAGIHAITMRNPDSAAGIKSSSVMYHFENKNGLMQEISSSYLQLFFKRLEKIKTTIDNPFLLSEHAGWATGANWDIDGGVMAGRN